MTGLIGHCIEIKRQQYIISCTLMMVKHVHKEQTGLILPCCSQKPITGESYFHVFMSQRFYRPDYLPNDFGANLDYLLSPTKTCRPKTGIFDLQMTFSFPLLISYIPNALIEGVYLPGKKCSKIYLKDKPVCENVVAKPFGFWDTC